MGTLCVNKNPCSSCPYRKDVPSGIWDKEEYDKLRLYDNNELFSTFLCHNSVVTEDTVCKGWLVVHAESAAARISVMKGMVDSDDRYDLPTVELFTTGGGSGGSWIKGNK